jgi:O-glycosyl hydrolase
MNLTNCVYQSFDIPPHYWTLRQFVKFVRQGAVRIAASSSSGDVRAVAFTDSKRQQTIIVAINNNATTNLRVAFTGTPSGSATVSTVTQASVNNASQGQSGAQTSQVTAQNGQFTVTLLARSLTTFVFGP